MVRRLAYEAADCGLLSADLAAGIRRVNGAKWLGMSVGNWLTAEQGKQLLLTANSSLGVNSILILKPWNAGTLVILLRVCLILKGTESAGRTSTS